MTQRDIVVRLRDWAKADGQMPLYEDAANEIERLRAALSQSKDAMNQMLIWEPSGFAPQSKADARQLARNAIKVIDALTNEQSAGQGDPQMGN